MRRAAPLLTAVVLLALASCTAADDGGPEGGSAPTGAAASPSPSSSAPGEPSAAAGAPALTVRQAGGTWVVRGTGFAEGGNQYLVQCRGGTAPGAEALDECDMSTREQVVADGEGRISATRQARAFVHVGSVTEVDCAQDPCALAVADLADRVVAAAPALLPDDAEPPAAPVLELSERELDEDTGTVTVAGTGYPAGAVVRLAQCATTPEGGVDTENCLYDDGRRVVADGDGAVTARLPVEREIALVGGGSADCAQPGACVVANARTDGVRLATVDLLWERAGDA